MNNKLFHLLSTELSSYEAKYIIEEVGPDEDKILEILQKRKQGIPLDRIFQKRGFYNHEFVINDSCLSPRADSEIMIEAILASKINPKNIVDIGTGSGCLLLTLLDIFKSAKGTGLDISQGAVNMAKTNADNLKITNAGFKKIDILKEDFDFSDFDLIISNPPYIPTQDIDSLDDNVKNFDPALALDGGEDGLVFYKRFYELLKDSNPRIFFEFGINQEDEIIEIFKGFKHELFKDYNQIKRVIYFHK
ncbi:MAG: peptide chain release factor N(5)-glutamine methyltransferase [Rickettsiales bacterium]|jgi:release factor glutamine methyltransferase|nr:peptide chain release factor N(5)-glutamine methyltransferase [Rickettsiales bacterium]